MGRGLEAREHEQRRRLAGADDEGFCTFTKRTMGWPLEVVSAILA